jgi:hypothetical protein
MENPRARKFGTGVLTVTRATIDLLPTVDITVRKAYYLLA